MTHEHDQPPGRDHEHDEDCACMYRLVAVAGELYVPPERERRAPAAPRLAATPVSGALPYTGLHMAVGYPSTVIVSDLLSGVFPSDLGGPVLLLGGSTGDYPTGDYPTITITDEDVEEIIDLTTAPDPHAVPTVPGYQRRLESSTDLALG